MVRNLAGVCKPGAGRVLVRDYACGDLAELRLAGGARQNRLADNFYARGDGTRAFYFSQARRGGHMVQSVRVTAPCHDSSYQCCTVVRERQY